MFLNGKDQRNLLTMIKSPSRGGGNATIDASITIQGNASQSVVDQIKAEQQKFAAVIRDTVQDLQYRRQLKFV